MKRSLRFGLLLLLSLAVGSCQRHTIIPDDQLALIFRDAFLVNAHLTREAKLDSLNVYEPIFARYGYTTADVQYTIGNFSKRKSARLGDVVELAIDLLEEQGKLYDREVAILDTIDRVAERTMTRRVFADSVIRVRSLKDTTRLRIAIDAEPGSYTVEFSYRIDSTDRNERVRGELWLERRNGVRSNIATTTLWKNRDDHYSRTFRADSIHKTIHLDLGLFDGKPRQPAITVEDLRIDYTPLTEAAVEQLAERQYNVRIFADEFFERVMHPAAAGGEAKPETEPDEE